jgi:hypothetical protein
VGSFILVVVSLTNIAVVGMQLTMSIRNGRYSVESINDAISGHETYITSIISNMCINYEETCHSIGQHNM